MSFMRDNSGIPHPITCGIFGPSKTCDHLSPTQLEESEWIIGATTSLGEDIWNDQQDWGDQQPEK